MVEVITAEDPFYDVRVTLHFAGAEVIPVQYTSTKRMRPVHASLHYQAHSDQPFVLTRAVITGPSVRINGTESDHVTGSNSYGGHYPDPPVWLAELIERHRPTR